ncbi:MAG: hypothetical protein NZ990_13290 [Myxococcota bacterium]|nr:hypothetical protein [Myxococcota bacterium]
MKRTIALLVLSLALGPFPSGAESPPRPQPFDELEIKELTKPGPHWFWVTDSLFRHSQLFDASSGEMLATLDNAVGAFAKPPIFSPTRNEYYVIEAKNEWGHRGPRTDFVTVYNAKTMKAKGQIVVPTQSAESAANIAYAALLDGNRTLLLFNQFPTQSVSVVDLEARTFVASIPTGGCAGVYATGKRSFATLCGNGTIRQVEFDAQGDLSRDDTTTPFFDAVEDPIMMNGARVGERWSFISFAGVVHEVDFSQSPPSTNSWPTVSEADKRDRWIPGGRQLTAIHRGLGRFYALYHQGGSGSHKDPGPEVWVFDLETHQRIHRFPLPNMDAAALAGMLEMSGGFSGWLLRQLIPATGADTLSVTQDDAPLLVLRNSALPLVTVLDAQNGAHLRDIEGVGLTGFRLEAVR